MLLLRIQRCRAGGTTLPPLEEEAARFWVDWKAGTTTDLEEPERERVAMRVAARQSGLVGSAAAAAVGRDVLVWHDTCHFSRTTEEMATLKKPMWEAQAEQAMLSIRGGGGCVASGAESEFPTPPPARTSELEDAGGAASDDDDDGRENWSGEKKSK